jgi:MerR family transcriptional regulator, light-induced transcriptional regulator
MYTIKEASARTGVGAPLIRAWERRYGVVTPARTASGYRLYDEGALRVLLAMRALVESGWTASEAARAIGAGEVSVDEVAADPRHTRLPDLPANDHRARLVARFVGAAEAASPVETEAVLDEVLASGSFEAIVDDLLMPATAALGDAWAAGRLSVAAEHAASAAVARRLSAIFQAAGVPGRVSVVVGLPPGARHELGALAFAAALRRRGVGVLYLGPDVTVDGWVDAVVSSRARRVVIGTVTGTDAEAAAAVVEALRPLGVRTIAMGGAAATAETTSRLGVVRLPDRIVDAATMVAQAAARRG